MATAAWALLMTALTASLLTAAGVQALMQALHEGGPWTVQMSLALPFAVPACCPLLQAHNALLVGEDSSNPAMQQVCELAASGCPWV